MQVVETLNKNLNKYPKFELNLSNDMESKLAATPANESQTTKPTRKQSSEGSATEEVFKEDNNISKTSSTNGEAEEVGTSEPTEEWIEGTQLVMVIISLIFGSFLMLLDTSIISTVSLL